MAIIYLYDKTATNFTYNGQPLPEAYQAHVDYIMNDEFFITFRYPLDKEKRYKEIEKDKIVTAHTPDGMQPFRIIDTVKRMDSVEVEAWPLFYADMRNKLVQPLSLKNATGLAAISQFMSYLLVDTPFVITTNITARHDYNTQNEQDKEDNPNRLYDALEVFKAIVNRWNGEVVINGYDIRILDRIGENKESLLYERKNIANFADGESIVDIVTRVHGKSEWTETNDDGEQIEHSIKATVDSPLIDAYSGVIFEKQYTNNDIRTKKKLEDWLSLKFTTNHIDKPKRNIEVHTNVVDGQEINTGDRLVLRYTKHDVDMEIRMIGYRYDGFTDRYITIYLGDAKESLIGNFQNSIKDVEVNVSENIQQVVADVIVNKLGQKVIFSELQPQGDFRKGDIWYDNEGGMWLWDTQTSDWIPHPFNQRTDIIEDLVKDAQEDIKKVRNTANKAAADISNAIEGSGYLNLADLIASKITDGEASSLFFQEAKNIGLAYEENGELKAMIGIIDGSVYQQGEKILFQGDEIIADGTLTVTEEMFAEGITFNWAKGQTFDVNDINVINLNMSHISGGSIELTKGFKITNNGHEVLSIDAQTGEVVFDVAGIPTQDELDAAIDGVELTPGKNAYEIALEQGFVGTKQEWLDSLHGKDGTPGNDGEPTYTWIKYADTPTSGMSDNPEDKKYIGMAFNKKTPTGTIDYHDYQWSLMPQNIEIGGRNYLANSSFESGNTGWTTQSGTVLYEDGVAKTTGTPAEIYKTGILAGFDVVTVSVWVKGTGRFQARAGGGSRAGYTDFSHTDFKQVSSTFSDMGNTNLILTLDGENLEVEKIKLEKGNIASDYQEAPEDTEEKINKKADTEVVDELNEKVSDTESLIENNSTEILSMYERMQSYRELLEQNEIDSETALQEIENLLAREVAIQENLGEFAREMNFINTQIRYSEEGIYIQNVNKETGQSGNKSIRISNDSIDFMDGNTRMGYMSGQTLYVTHAHFDTVQFGEHKAETINGRTGFIWIKP